MIKKIRDIWNLENIIEDKIKKYKIAENLYAKEKNSFIFQFKDIELIISENNLILNKVKYISPSEIKIFEKNFLFRKQVYVNSLLLKENSEFLKNIISEWKDKKTALAEMEAKHILITLKEDIKEKYFKNLNFLLEKTSPLKIIKDKYVFSIGRSLDLEERKIFDFFENNECKVYSLKENYNKFILAD